MADDHFDADLDQEDPSWDPDEMWDSWRGRIKRLVALNVHDRGLLADQEEWATRQLGELIVAAGEGGEMAVDPALFRFCDMLHGGRNIESFPDTVTAFCRVVLAAFSGSGLTFELALDGLSQALENIARQRPPPKATPPAWSAPVAFDDALPPLGEDAELPAWW